MFFMFYYYILLYVFVVDFRNLGAVIKLQHVSVHKSLAAYRCDAYDRTKLVMTRGGVMHQSWIHLRGSEGLKQ